MARRINPHRLRQAMGYGSQALLIKKLQDDTKYKISSARRVVSFWATGQRPVPKKYEHLLAVHLDKRLTWLKSPCLPSCRYCKMERGENNG